MIPASLSPVKTKIFHPFFVWLKILLLSAMKIKVYPPKPCFSAIDRLNLVAWMDVTDAEEHGN